MNFASYIRAVDMFAEKNKDCADPYLWRKGLSEVSNARLDLSQQLGGIDFSVLEMAKIFELFGSIDLELRDVPGIGHARMLQTCNSQFSRQLLDSVARNEAFVGIAITEEGAGSDIRGMQTRAVSSGNGYRLNGTKLYNARIKHASYFIVFARLEDAGPGSALAAFAVPTDKCTVFGISAMGHRNFSWGGLQLDDVAVPREARLLPNRPAEDLLKIHFSYWRIMMAAAAIGCAKTALDTALSRLSQRKAFGKIIGEMTHLQTELAIHIASVQSAALLCHWVADRHDRLGKDDALSALVKAECVERAVAAVDWTMKVHGAKGYSEEMDLEKRYRDLLGLRIADGATDVLRCSAARHFVRGKLKTPNQDVWTTFSERLRQPSKPARMQLGSAHSC